MKKIVLLFLCTLFFCKISFAASITSDFNLIETLLERAYVKVSVTVKVDEKKVKGFIKFNESNFTGDISCIDKYRATLEGKMNGDDISAKLFLYNVRKSKLLYKITINGTKQTGRWTLYNAADVAIAKGTAGSHGSDNTEVLNPELFTKFMKTFDRIVNACTLN